MVYKNETAININKNSKLPINFLTSYSSFKRQIKSGRVSTGKYVENYISFDYHYDDYFISFAGYPNDECDFYLTQMKIKSYNYHVLSITIGDRIDCADKILEEFGYIKKYNERDWRYFKTFYKLNDIYIRFKIEDNIITEIYISAASIYLGNCLYWIIKIML